MKTIALLTCFLLVSAFVPVRAQGRDRDFLNALNALSKIEIQFADQHLDLESSRVAREQLKKEVVAKIPLGMCGLFANLLRELHLQGEEKRFPVYELAHSCLAERLLSEERNAVRKILPTFNTTNLDASWGLRIREIREYASDVK